MDPDETLATFFYARAEAALAAEGDEANLEQVSLAQVRLQEAVEAASALFEWLAKGGSAPHWGCGKDHRAGRVVQARKLGGDIYEIDYICDACGQAWTMPITEQVITRPPMACLCCQSSGTHLLGVCEICHGTGHLEPGDTSQRFCANRGQYQ